MSPFADVGQHNQCETGHNGTQVGIAGLLMGPRHGREWNLRPVLLLRDSDPEMRSAGAVQSRCGSLPLVGFPENMIRLYPANPKHALVGMEFIRHAVKHTWKNCEKVQQKQTVDQ